MARLTQDRRRGMTPPPLECRVRERIHIHPVPVHQSISGLIEEAHIHSNTRNVGPKSRLPDVAGTWPHSSGQTRTSPHASPTNVPDRLGPSPSNHAPFDWATPQLSHLQMDVDHMYIQRRLDPHLTDRAKTRGIMAKRPVGPIPSTTT